MERRTRKLRRLRPLCHRLTSSLTAYKPTSAPPWGLYKVRKRSRTLFSWTVELQTTSSAAETDHRIRPVRHRLPLKLATTSRTYYRLQSLLPSPELAAVSRAYVYLQSLIPPPVLPAVSRASSYLQSLLPPPVLPVVCRASSYLQRDDGQEVDGEHVESGQELNGWQELSGWQELDSRKGWK
jgi:hypothetical protein